MKLACIIAQRDIAIANYNDICHLQMNLQTPNVPSQVAKNPQSYLSMLIEKPTTYWHQVSMHDRLRQFSYVNMQHHPKQQCREKNYQQHRSFSPRLHLRT
jgi:hypothetical protein